MSTDFTALLDRTANMYDSYLEAQILPMFDEAQTITHIMQIKFTDKGWMKGHLEVLVVKLKRGITGEVSESLASKLFNKGKLERYTLLPLSLLISTAETFGVTEELPDFSTTELERLVRISFLRVIEDNNKPELPESVNGTVIGASNFNPQDIGISKPARISSRQWKKTTGQNVLYLEIKNGVAERETNEGVLSNTLFEKHFKNGEMLKRL